MSEGPLMPKATAVWLVENTSISFKQIADFCNLHELEIKGIADGDVAKGIKAYNPVLAGQLTRDEIEACSKDKNRPLELTKKTVEIRSNEKKRPKYIPLSKRHDKPDAIHWLTKNYSQLSDGQISKLIGKMQREGFTLIPTKMYFKKGKAKIEIAVAKGKKQYDKRQTKKTKDWNRDKARYFRKSS